MAVTRARVMMALQQVHMADHGVQLAGLCNVIMATHARTITPSIGTASSGQTVPPLDFLRISSSACLLDNLRLRRPAGRLWGTTLKVAAQVDRSVLSRGSQEGNQMSSRDSCWCSERADAARQPLRHKNNSFDLACGERIFSSASVISWRGHP